MVFCNRTYWNLETHMAYNYMQQYKHRVSSAKYLAKNWDFLLIHQFKHLSFEYPQRVLVEK